MTGSSTNHVSVKHMTGDRFAIDIRDHQLYTDQPVADGGYDTAPAPTELFAASIASCVAFFAHRYLVRHHIDEDGLDVTLDYELGGRPARITHIDIVITPPRALPEERRDAFIAVASHCTLHNTLDAPPTTRIQLNTAPRELTSVYPGG